MPLEIRSASAPSEFKRFVDLPYRLYKGDPVWVPLLKDDVRLLFNKVKNPFFAHGEVEPFLALRDGRVVGRITAIDNRRTTSSTATRSASSASSSARTTRRLRPRCSTAPRSGCARAARTRCAGR
jgi:hypothetical protein